MQTSALHAMNHHFTLPICKDCRHADAIGAPFVSPQCLHPKGPITRDLVTGVITAPACRDERGQDGECGEEGRRFEAWTVEGDVPREEAERILACAEVVAVRMPYSSRASWIRRCHPDSILARSASMADSSMTARSGRAAAPNSCWASNQAPCRVSATESMALARELAYRTEAADMPRSKAGANLDLEVLQPTSQHVTPALTVVLIGPQGCGKSTHAQAFARAFGCTHVIDGQSLNGFDVDDPAAITREGALIIGPERAEDCPCADLVIEARTKAGFDKAVALLPSGA